MERLIEQELVLPHVTICLGSVEWKDTVDINRADSHYHICQRLSEEHSPLRIGNVNAREAFPRVKSVAFLPPEHPVTLYPFDGPFRMLDCCFEREHFEEVAGITAEHWELHTDALVAIRNRRLELLMQEILAELTQPDFAHERVIEAACTMILVEMARYGRHLDRIGAQGVIENGLAPWQLRRVQERITTAPIVGYPTIDELASLCGISARHLMRNFKISTGWPIHKYIAQERFNVAKELLLQEDLNTSEVADRLGFRSSAYFATAFRKLAGVTPSDYRKQQLAERRQLN